MKMRQIVLALCAALLLLLMGPVVSSSSARPLSPDPVCWNYWSFTRSGTTVRIVGTEMYQISSGYMLVWPSDQYGKSYSAYNASPYGGANFVIDTGRSGKQTIYVSVTDSSNTQTWCHASAYV